MNTDKKTYSRLFGITAALLSAILLLVGVFFYSGYTDLQNNLLRLLVIAASDTDADQALKLKVRDAVLLAGATIFDGSVTAADAQARVQPQIADLKAAAEQVLTANGCRDRVTVTIGREYFPERQYDTITLPPGFYQAVKVVIGAGKGHNWWCVMFPPMCLPAAEQADPAETFTTEETDMLTRPKKYQLRFKTAELIGKVIDKVKHAREK